MSKKKSDTDASDSIKSVDESSAVLTKFESYEIMEIHRSSIKNAPYNPRVITPAAREKIKKNIAKVGLLDPIIWNTKTGNIVGGHQRLSCVDLLEGSQNYKIRVAAVNLSTKVEKEQNIFLNNDKAQGDWDWERLEALIKQDDVDFVDAGFDESDINTMFGTENLAVKPLLDLAEKMRERAEAQKSIASRLSSASNDGPNFFSVLVFKTYEERSRFFTSFGFPSEQYVNAHVLIETMCRMGLRIDLKAINNEENSYIDVSHCPRCGCTHENMQFMPLTGDSSGMNHWAMCVTTGQPLLIQIELRGEEYVVSAGLDDDEPIETAGSTVASDEDEVDDTDEGEAEDDSWGG